LETPIENAKHSLDALNFSFYQYFGAGIFGNIIEPVSPKKTSQKIVDDLVKSYSEFIYNFKELSKYFDAHMNELKEILTQREILALEAFVKAFENDTPDYKFLLDHGAVREIISKEYRRKKTFSEELKSEVNKKMKENRNFIPIINTINTPQVDTQRLIGETMARIMLEKTFSFEDM
jgi:hypothetical protein